MHGIDRLQLAATLVLAALCLAAGRAQGSDPDWLIVPGERVGPITAATSEAALATLFGADNVQRVDVELGEGVTEPGTRPCRRSIPACTR